jgi:enoyl-CoA hydratase/carnithine racemase
MTREEVPDMPEPELLVEKRGFTAVVTLNRPDRLNALSDDMFTRLPELWTEIGADDDVRAIILTATGRGFCVGMDLKKVKERGGFRKPRSDKVSEALKLSPLNNDVWLPTIVAVNGVCAGGGLHFIADADVVLASDASSFVDPHVTNGQASALEPISLAARMGHTNAMRFAMLGRAGMLDPHEAVRLGLADEVVPADDLVTRALELADAFAAQSPSAVEATKRAARAALELPHSEAMQVGWDLVMEQRKHPDALEGPAAFAEKRDPRWTRVRPNDQT